MEEEMNYRIREARPEDLDRLVALGVVLQQHLEASNPELWRIRPSDQRRAQFNAGMEDPDTQVLVATDPTDRVIGMIMGRIESREDRTPRTTGHLMVLPKRHLAAFEDLYPEEWEEMGRMAAEAKSALDTLYGPDGYNMGLNLGEAAGAGIADHLHLHVVPRWQGDNNFMPVTADVRVMSHHLETVYSQLKETMSP